MSEMKLLTPRDVAKMLGFKPRTIARWCRDGVFPEARKVGRVWRIPHDDYRLHMLIHVNEERRLRGRR